MLLDARKRAQSMPDVFCITMASLISRRMIQLVVASTAGTIPVDVGSAAFYNL